MSEDYYSLNLQTLRDKEPHLANQLESVEKSSHIPSFHVTLQPDLYLKESIIVILGFGDGEHIKRLINQSAPNSLLLVIDPNLRLFKTALSTRDLTPILKSPKVSLAIGETPIKATRERLTKHFKGMIIETRIKVLESNSLVRLNPQYYEEVKALLKDIYLEAMQNVSTLREKASLWQRNIFENLPLILRYPGVDLLFGKFREVPAIIVAAGPSLDKNAKELRAVKGHSLIIGVDTSIKTLLKYDVEPDLLVSIGGEEENYRYYLKDLKLQKAYLVADAVVYPSVPLGFDGKIFITNDGHPFMNWLGRSIGFRGYLAKGGSVATTSLDLALRMGCNPIIFVGQDLAYPKGETHTQEVPLSKRRREVARRRKELLLVKDVFGEKVVTSYTLYNVLRWFEAKIEEKSTQLFIDATEGGARIRGTRVMKLRDAICTFCQTPIDVEGVLSQAMAEYKPPPPKGLIEELLKIAEEWRIVLELAKEGKNLQKKFEKLKDASCDRAKRLLQRITFIYEEIIEQRKFMKLSSWDLTPYLQQMEVDGAGESTLELSRIYKKFFNKIYQICVSGIWQVEEALKRLEEGC